MKKFFVIATAILLSVVSANAQYKMKVTLNDGHISDFFVSEIKDISWEEYKPGGEGNDENEPTVTGDATDVTTTTATITAWANNILDNLSTDLEVGIIYTSEGTPSKSNGKKQIVNTSDIASDGEYSVKLTGLLPSTTYSYRSYVYQSDLYFYGKVKSFTTKGQNENIVTGEVSNITCYSAKVAATVNIDSKTSYKSLKYGVCYGSTSALSVSNAKVVEGSSRNTDGSFSVTLRALAGSTIYYYRTYACVDGFYEYGEVRSFQTIADNVVETGEYDEETGTVTSKLTIGSGAYSNLQVGLCWSKTSEMPTIEDYKETTNELDDENRYAILPMFELGTYNYRAYVLIDNVVHYGIVKNIIVKNTCFPYVDLGLSVKWATCNVGVSFFDEYGDYYAWGETETKDYYDWSTYKWCKGSNYTMMTKYCTNSSYGTVDNKKVLEPEDDVAHVKWGGNWRMPTLEEWKELREKCTWSIIASSKFYGMNNYKITSKSNGNSIFLPAGFVYDANFKIYWSASLCKENPSEAWSIIMSDKMEMHDRSSRALVRPVCP